MADSPSDSETLKPEDRITLGLLNAVHENSSASQRFLATELGIALGLANAYLKRCVKKGLIKVQQVPANRYAYYLTPKGFSEKSRLTVRYLSMSFDFFRHARRQCGDVFDACAERGWTRIGLAGVGDLGEVATLSVRDRNVDLLGFVDAGAEENSFAGFPVVAAPGDLPDLQALVITDLQAPQETFEHWAAELGAERVLAPSLLNISRQRVEGA